MGGTKGANDSIVPSSSEKELESGTGATAGPRASPLVFISHDSRDADLAKAFDNLLTDASGGVIQTFRSSDQSGRAGIDYGENWYSKIASTLSDATDVVALLTPSSIGRPWILFEAGFAVGRLDTKVFGIALGLPLSKAVLGPFAQFQNCEANEESLTTVVLKLIQRNPQARPREQAVRRQVTAFLQEVDPLLKQRANGKTETREELDATSVAKLFEEVKVMFRDLSSRSQPESDGRRSRTRRRLHPMMLDELFHPNRRGSADLGLSWMMLASYLKDDFIWLYEPAMHVSRAFETGRSERIERALKSFASALQMMRHSHFLARAGADEDETFLLVRYLPEMLERFMFSFADAERKVATEAITDSSAPPVPKKRSEA